MVIDSTPLTFRLVTPLKMYVTLRVKEGLKPKSSRAEKEVMVMKMVQIPTISGGIILRIKGSNRRDEAIFRKVAP